MNGVNICPDVTVVNMASTGPRRDHYHHGALREALIGGARTLLAEKGVEAFSLSELARRIGVSPAAPYRHFDNRDALLGAVAEVGYRRLLEVLQETARSSQDPRDLVQRLGSGYVRFATDNPELFSVMFNGRYRSEAGEARQLAFQSLVDGVRQAQDAGVLPAELPTREVARAMWATAHGLTVLHLNGGLDAVDLDDTPDRLTVTAWISMTGVTPPDTGTATED